MKNDPVFASFLQATPGYRHHTLVEYGGYTYGYALGPVVLGSPVKQALHRLEYARWPLYTGDCAQFIRLQSKQVLREQLRVALDHLDTSDGSTMAAAGAPEDIEAPVAHRLQTLLKAYGLEACNPIATSWNAVIHAALGPPQEVQTPQEETPQEKSSDQARRVEARERRRQIRTANELDRKAVRKSIEEAHRAKPAPTPEKESTVPQHPDTQVGSYDHLDADYPIAQVILDTDTLA